MKTIKKKILSVNKPLLFGLILTSLTLIGCGSSSNNDTKTFKVSVDNLTANQPLSPMAIVIHKPSYNMFQAGQSASVALEKLAEGGSNQQLLDEASTDDGFIASVSGETPIPPGHSDTIELSIREDSEFVYISLASMLVNTNDAFASATSKKFGTLKKGESFRMHVPIWDAGTEANSEQQGTIPGPADGGEGFNSNRSGDANFVAIHQGVVTKDDGLSTSVLNESHRFNNPGAMLSVERIK